MADKEPCRINQKRLIKTFKDIKRLNSGDEIRFCFLIGSGASKSSGIKTGWELSQEWYKDLKEDLTSEELLEWQENIDFSEENIGFYYPHIYKKRYEALPQIGYEEFKKLMDNVDPGIGYLILSQILTKEKHNFVITTNFDYLIEDSVRMYTSQKPFSAGHEMLAEFISSQTERPTIIKVHRDLFLNPFNDEDETQKLKEEWKKALTPILRNFNLLVIGYGGNDGSLMDYLSNVDAESRKSIYWCVRNEDELNSKITNLLNEKDYIVTIEGFDELMISLNDALEYTIFDDLEKPEKHPFVIEAKNRITQLNKKLKDLLEKLAKNNIEISEETQDLFTGSMKYLLDAYQEKDIDEKQKIYEKGIADYPKEASLFGDYALFLKNIRKDYDKAQKYYKKAIELNPEEADFQGNYAIFLSDVRNDYDKAEEYYKKAIELNPENAAFQGNYAIFLNEVRKDYDRAEQFYKKAIELNPEEANFQGNYAVYLKETINDYDKAEEYYKKAIELDPEEANFQGNYANFLSDIRKDYDKAERYYEKAIELNPEDADFQGNYAHHLIIVKQDFKSAENYIDKSFELLGDENDLTVELWFYRYAHYKKWLQKAEKQLQKLLSKGIKSTGWNLEPHVQIAKQNGHPDVKMLQEFAEAITKE